MLLLLQGEWNESPVMAGICACVRTTLLLQFGRLGVRAASALL